VGLAGIVMTFDGVIEELLASISVGEPAGDTL
jgi:hypothetical protein